MLTIRAMSDGKGYSSRHLEHRDYYAEGERVVGHWQGRGAQLLGLTGKVRSEDFEALREGRDHRTVEFLRQRQGADRIGPDGTTRSRARSLYDFTISAPKSVSVAAMLGGDTRLIDAHEKAVAETLQELEKYAAARVRQDGANEDRTTGNLVLAVYHHDTSRELDPQLHTHAVAANVTYDGTEVRWKALQASGVYERRAYLTEVYRNALAHNVRALGYEIENRRGAKGRDCGFEIRGISDELLSKYSRRSRQRDRAIEEFMEKNGRAPTDNEVAVLIRETRADKLIEISTSEVRTQQCERLTKTEATTLMDIRNKAQAIVVPLDSPQASFEYAKAHVFERISVAKDHEVLTEALRHGRGQISTVELDSILSLEKAAGKLFHDRNEIATAESLQREREMVRFVNRGIGAFTPLARGKQFKPQKGLRPEQRRVVEFVLNSRDQVVNIQGAAGTGKTATLEELRRGLQESGHGVIAVGPTMSAAEELQKVGFREAISVERLLQDPRKQNALQNAVVILDEAGMVSSRQMSELLRLADGYAARIIFSGDTRQIQSVEAGDALRILEKESQMKSLALTDVQRQKRTDYRKAIQELRRNPEQGFQELDAIGAIHESPWLERAARISNAYTEFGSEGQSVLVVCPTHQEIERVTGAIRAVRKATGQLGKSIPMTRDVSLNWTTAQKSDMRTFQAGQLLCFHRAVKGIAKNETVEVVRSEGKSIIVRNSEGKNRTITGKQSGCFDVLERRAIEVAAGDKLLIRANRRGPQLQVTNGEIVTVSKLDTKGRIHLGDGRILPVSFKQFAHGYAVTAHRSQGKSVDAVIISGDGMQEELFYVAASRGRERVLVFTSDKENLRESVARSTARKSATELAKRIGIGLHQGMRRGRDLARRLLNIAARQAPVFEQPAVKQQFIEGNKVKRRNEHSISR